MKHGLAMFVNGGEFGLEDVDEEESRARSSRQGRCKAKMSEGCRRR